MRRGTMIMMRHEQLDGALKAFDRAEAMTRDPYVVYLVHFFRAQIYERRRQMQHAEAAYRAAVAAIPRAQSATVAFAALLFTTAAGPRPRRWPGRVLAPRPMPPDPWREYVHADDCFWPQLIATTDGDPEMTARLAMLTRRPGRPALPRWQGRARRPTRPHRARRFD